MEFQVIGREQFKSQMSRLSILFLRETKKEMLDEYWQIFKGKDFKSFENAVNEIIKQENRFPTPHTLNYYYEMYLPAKEKQESPEAEDLNRSAKSETARYYCNLIYELVSNIGIAEKRNLIKIDDSRFLKALEQHKRDASNGKCKLVFTGYDAELRCWKKHRT